MKDLRGSIILAASILLATGALFLTPGSAGARMCSSSGSGSACSGGFGNEYTGTMSGSLKFGSSSTITSGFLTVNCGTSSFFGSIVGTANVQWTSVTMGNCTSGLGACTASTSATTGSWWSATVSVSTAPNGTLRVFTEEWIEYTCGGTKCIYGASSMGSSGEIVVQGGSPATITATKVPLSKRIGSNFLCSNTATWSAGYSVSTPSSLYVT
jgi:hypothetical protein